MKNTKWIVKPEYNSEYINKLRENSDIELDSTVLNILCNRGITTKEDILKFINPSLDNMQNPFDLEDVQKAVKIIKKAIELDKNVWIYGDYDVDGITSTSLLYLALKRLGLTNVNYYIPLRSEGYGLNKVAIKKIKDSGADLLITVDCGITSFDEINYANEIQLPIIVTDHHGLLNDSVPNALCVINPKRKENKFKFSELAGVGTIFMVLCALYSEYDRLNEMYEYLDIVSIGTIADIVPLLEENRIIVHYGLQQFPKTKNRGLSHLLDAAFNYNSKNIKKNVYSTYDIGFIIAPLFNAAGRLKDAKIAVKLLISDNTREIEAIVKELIHQNIERKTVQEDIIQKVVKNVEENKLEDDMVIVDASNEYHHGVIGIVASKIVDIYYKPTIIIELKESEGIGVASCRSIENFDILGALQSMPELFIKFGGHKGAAGFTIKSEYIPIFKKKINDYAKKKIIDEDLQKIIEIDSELELHNMSYDLNADLSKLYPFGFGNPQPIFVTKRVMFDNVRLIGENKNHLMFDLKKKGFQNKNAVWFNSGDIITEVNKNLFYDVVYKIKMEEYKGYLNVKAYVEDIKVSDLKDDKIKYLQSIAKVKLPQKTMFLTKQKIDVDGEIKLKDSFDEILVYQGRQCIGNLDYNTSYLIKLLKDYYGWEIVAEIDSWYDIKDTGTWVELILDRNYELSCRDKNEVVIFNAIKNFFTSDLDYNSITKTLLADVFKNNKNVIVTFPIKKDKIVDNKVYVRDDLKLFLINLIMYKLIKTNYEYNQEISFIGDPACYNLQEDEEHFKEMEKAFDMLLSDKVSRECNIEFCARIEDYLSDSSNRRFGKGNMNIIVIYDYNNDTLLRTIKNIKSVVKKYVIIVVQCEINVNIKDIESLGDDKTSVINNVIEVPNNVQYVNEVNEEIYEKYNDVYSTYFPNKEKMEMKKRLVEFNSDDFKLIADNNIVEIL